MRSLAPNAGADWNIKFPGAAGRGGGAGGAARLNGALQPRSPCGHFSLSLSLPSLGRVQLVSGLFYGDGSWDAVGRWKARRHGAGGEGEASGRLGCRRVQPCNPRQRPAVQGVAGNDVTRVRLRHLGPELTASPGRDQQHEWRPHLQSLNAAASPGLVENPPPIIYALFILIYNSPSHPTKNQLPT